MSDHMERLSQVEQPKESSEDVCVVNALLVCDLVWSGDGASGEELVNSIPFDPIDKDEQDLAKVRQLQRNMVYKLTKMRNLKNHLRTLQQNNREEGDVIQCDGDFHLLEYKDIVTQALESSESTLPSPLHVIPDEGIGKLYGQVNKYKSEVLTVQE
ncbi:hypothetical protein L1987_20856 [Smallanthus sonchifolius]|uniref:Uncharacterized protein n=1 Tax=Smallanthus sonchifolius TaxID=185202 RepID=A0ACB9ISZ5_9ASTR|nr:hypothetical protein L1987_20856 [Smallanthus sonchifolius]